MEENHKYHSSLGKFSSNYMNGSWRNCTQCVTSGNCKERKCDCQGSPLSLQGEGLGGALSPGNASSWLQEGACTQAPRLEELLFPHWFLGELTQRFTFAEQVSQILGKGKSVSIDFSMVLWFQ